MQFGGCAGGQPEPIGVVRRDSSLHRLLDYGSCRPEPLVELGVVIPKRQIAAEIVLGANVVDPNGQFRT